MSKVIGRVVHMNPIQVQDPEAKWLLFLPSGGVVAGRSYRKTLFRSYKVLELLDADGEPVAVVSPPYELIRADRFTATEVTDVDIERHRAELSELPTGVYV